MDVQSRLEIGLCAVVMGSVTVSSLWSRGKSDVRGHCHVVGRVPDSVHDCLDYRMKEIANEILDGTNAYPPDSENRIVVDYVAERTCETIACPPDSVTLDVEENDRPPQTCVRESGVGCPC